MKKTKIGLMGAGRLGRCYARYLSRQIPTADLVAISDIEMSHLQSCADEVGVSRSYADYRELLAGKSVDAVVIATPT